MAFKTAALLACTIPLASSLYRTSTIRFLPPNLKAVRNYHRSIVDGNGTQAVLQTNGRQKPHKMRQKTSSKVGLSYFLSQLVKVPCIIYRVFAYESKIQANLKPNIRTSRQKYWEESQIKLINKKTQKEKALKKQMISGDLPMESLLNAVKCEQLQSR